MTYEVLRIRQEIHSCLCCWSSRDEDGLCFVGAVPPDATAVHTRDLQLEETACIGRESMSKRVRGTGNHCCLEIRAEAGCTAAVAGIAVIVPTWFYYCQYSSSMIQQSMKKYIYSVI